MDGWTDGWMDGWMDEWTGGWGGTDPVKPNTIHPAIPSIAITNMTVLLASTPPRLTHPSHSHSGAASLSHLTLKKYNSKIIITPTLITASDHTYK